MRHTSDNAPLAIIAARRKVPVAGNFIAVLHFLDVAGLVLPPNGVYSGFTRSKGHFYRVALNIGMRPTMISAKPELRVEAHLLDFSSSLYGVELEIEIGEKLRDERKFASPAELRAQITSDIADVRKRSLF